MKLPASHILRALLIACIVCAFLSACAATTDPKQLAGRHWVSSWGTAQAPVELNHALALPHSGRTTLRQIVRVSLPGATLRVRISNAFGSTPLVVEAASIALAAGPGLPNVDPALLRTLRFDGNSAVSIGAGAERASDPVSLAHEAGADLAISIYVTGLPVRQTGHPGSRATSFVATGNHVLDAVWSGEERVARWHQLASVEVLASAGTSTLVAIGDSITDGYGVAPDTNARWTDFLASRLRGAGIDDIGVVNAGLGGGHLLSDGSTPGVVSRFARDVLERPGVSHAIVLAGVNDLGALHRSGGDTAAARARLLDQMKQALRTMAALAHEQGVCMIGATLPPYGGSSYYRPGPENNSDRRTLNEWIRSSGVFDAVVDFDAVLRDPASPAALRPDYDNDGLHPSIAGYRAMAGAFPLAALQDCGAATPAAARP